MNNAQINSDNVSNNQGIAMANIILTLRELPMFGMDLEWQFGYNETSGNVWCWLPMYNITIAAADYRPYEVTFFVNNDEGEEQEFETYEEAAKAAGI